MCGERGDALHERLGARAERELDAALRAEQVGDHGPRRVPDVLEEQRRAAGRDHAAVDLGDLQVGVDRRVDLHQLARGAQAREQHARLARCARTAATS